MAKQTINVGTTANDKKGDSLRAAFTKVNANFTELYTALGLNTDGTLNLGAFEFTGSTMSTTDSTPIVIDQSVTVSSDLTVGGDIVPSVANGGNLGSAAKPFKSLYVSNNTVFLGGVPLSLEAGTNTLKVNNVPISQNIIYADIPSAPTDISDLTDTTGLLGSGTGDITFTNSTISAGANDEVKVQGQDDDGVSVRLRLEPEYGTAELSAFSGENVNTFTISNADFATGVWQNNGFGIGVVSFTDAQNIGDFFQNTLQNLTPANVTISINGGAAFAWNGGTSGAGTTTPGLSNTPTVPPSPVAVTSISFRYRQQSYISVNYDNQEIRLDAQNAGIRMDANNSIQIYGDSEIDLQAATTFRIAAEEDINIGTGSSYAVRINGGDFNVIASNDIGIRGNDVFRLRNESSTASIEIITDDDNTSQTWAFNADGSLNIPGDIRSEREINIDINLTDSTLRRWRFGEDGELTLPATESNFGPTIETVTVANDGTDYQGVTITPDPDFDVGQGLRIYPTAAEGGHLHITANDPANVDLFLGDDDQYVCVNSNGIIDIQSRGGAATAGGNPAGAGGDIYITASDAGDNGGSSADGNVGGSVYINSGFSTSNNTGGEIRLATSSGIGGYGPVRITTDGSGLFWTFDKDQILTFPDGAKYEGQTVTMPTTTGTTNSFVWEFSDQVVGSDTITLNWNLLASDQGSFYIGTTHSTNGKYLILDGNDQSLSYIAGGTPTNGKLIFGATAGNNAGDVNAIELKAADGDVYLTSTESVKITVDAADSSARVWTFDPTGGITFPDATTQTTAFTLSPTLNVLKIDDGVHEKFQELADATGTVTHDCSSGHIFYHASPDANWTVNLTNLNLSTGYATTVTIIIDQGGTGYYPNALQIGGSAQTINWQGNATPTPSTNRQDVVSFSILAFSGGYTVFGQLTGF